MKKKLISVFCLTLIFVIVFSGINASANWLSPLAEKGDVNNDGFLTALDARTILRASSELVKLNPPSKWPRDQVFGDANGDGKVAAIDARIVLRRSLGLPDKEPANRNDSETLFSGTYYLTGRLIIAGGKTEDIIVAMRDDDYYVKTQYEGQDIEGLYLDGKYTLMNPVTGAYSAVYRNTLTVKGVELYNLITHFPVFRTTTPGSTAQATINGKSYTCDTFANSNGTYSKHYRDGKTLALIENYAKDGSLVSKIEVDFVSGDVGNLLVIPSNYVNVTQAAFFSYYN